MVSHPWVSLSSNVVNIPFEAGCEPGFPPNPMVTCTLVGGPVGKNWGHCPVLEQFKFLWTLGCLMLQVFREFHGFCVSKVIVLLGILGLRPREINLSEFRYCQSLRMRESRMQCYLPKTLTPGKEVRRQLQPSV